MLPIWGAWRSGTRVLAIVAAGQAGLVPGSRQRCWLRSAAAGSQPAAGDLRAQFLEPDSSFQEQKDGSATDPARGQARPAGRSADVRRLFPALPDSAICRERELRRQERDEAAGAQGRETAHKVRHTLQRSAEAPRHELQLCQYLSPSRPSVGAASTSQPIGSAGKSSTRSCGSKTPRGCFRLGVQAARLPRSRVNVVMAIGEMNDGSRSATMRRPSLCRRH